MSDEGADGRNETPFERYDRNWRDVQQELRIVQTGTQVLAGFLLTLPFQQRFGRLGSGEIGIYLCLVVLAASITIVALGAVAMHRLLFRRRRMHDLVTIGNRILLTCLVMSALLFAGTVLFVFDVVLGRPTGVLVGVVVFVATGVLWLALPLLARRTRRDDEG
jgi:peptidoglycan biosynthesis protein MviN/MurJ (putative lipid II flippase)